MGPESLCLEQALRDADVAGPLPTFLRSLGRHHWRVLGKKWLLNYCKECSVGDKGGPWEASSRPEITVSWG